MKLNEVFRKSISVEEPASGYFGTKFYSSIRPRNSLSFVCKQREFFPVSYSYPVDSIIRACV